MADLAALLGGLGSTTGAAGKKGGTKKLSVFSSADGPEWTTWRANFKIVARINDWKDLRSRREAAASLEGLAARTVADIDAEDADDIDALLDLYESRFLPAAQSELAQQSFDGAKQADGETVLQWHARCRELFQRAYPGDDTDCRQLIQKFALGLTDDEVRAWTWKQRAVSYQAVLLAANNETAAKAVLTQSRSAHGRRGLHAFGGNAGGGSRATGGPETRKCFFCERPGHIQADCRTFANYKKKAQDEAASGSSSRSSGSGSGGRGRGRRGPRGQGNGLTDAFGFLPGSGTSRGPRGQGQSGHPGGAPGANAMQHEDDAGEGELFVHEDKESGNE